MARPSHMVVDLGALIHNINGPVSWHPKHRLWLWLKRMHTAMEQWLVLML